jgi:hypothetical protein
MLAVLRLVIEGEVAAGSAVLKTQIGEIETVCAKIAVLA